MANKRLIDANVLIRDINADIYRTESEKSYDRCLVYRQPTVDAVEVVRCMECLYRSQYPDKDGLYKCGFFSIDGVAMMVSPDFYCKCGERRTDG